MINYKVAKFIHEEVERQGFRVGTAIHTQRCIWMADAWEFGESMRAISGSIITSDIVTIGHYVEPEINARGFRKVGVCVGDWTAPHQDAVPRLIEAWCEAVNDGRFTPDEAYKEFELIHPFADGNGRTGKIIHNMLGNTMDEPVLVQDFFGCGVP